MPSQSEPGASAAQEPARYGVTRAAEGGAPLHGPPATGAAAQEPGVLADLAVAGGPDPQALPTFHGRPVSWIAVSIVAVGFLVGGLALVFGPTWWVFWVGVGLAVLGGLLAMSTDIFEDWY